MTWVRVGWVDVHTESGWERLAAELGADPRSPSESVVQLPASEREVGQDTSS
jgi:hypothetical protein